MDRRHTDRGVADHRDDDTRLPVFAQPIYARHHRLARSRISQLPAQRRDRWRVALFSIPN
jgi:hypothetical protein